MSDSRYDLVIVGGGIIGLATACELGRRLPGRRIALLEKEAAFGRHQTGHNSGVIHSGIYYRPGSAKARLCVRGAARMVELCRAQSIPHRICGKLVVATRERELPGLEELHARGRANGVPGVELVGPERMREIEPAAAGLRGLWVPGTGVVDYVTVVERLAALAAELGLDLRLRCALRRVRRQGDGLELEVAGGGDLTRLQAARLVNCGGLHADRIARTVDGRLGLRIVPFRGEYYEVAAPACHLVRGLIYPVPDPRLPFLGVHLTSRVDGSVEAGPNAVLALHREGYRKGMVSARDVVDTLAWPGFWRMAARWSGVAVAEVLRSYSKSRFVRDLQRLVPALTAADLMPGGAGVRAQAIDRRGALLDDFAIIPGPRTLHICNAPSPAATASLAIAEEIADRVVE